MQTLWALPWEIGPGCKEQRATSGDVGGASAVGVGTVEGPSRCRDNFKRDKARRFVISTNMRGRVRLGDGEKHGKETGGAPVSETSVRKTPDVDNY